MCQYIVVKCGKAIMFVQCNGGDGGGCSWQVSLVWTVVCVVLLNSSSFEMIEPVKDSNKR